MSSFRKSLRSLGNAFKKKEEEEEVPASIPEGEPESPRVEFNETDAAEKLAQISASARKNRKSIHVRQSVSARVSIAAPRASVHTRSASRASDHGLSLEEEVEQYIEEGSRDAVVAAEIGQQLLLENTVLKSDLQEIREELASVKQRYEAKNAELEKENNSLQEAKRKLANKLVTESASPSKSDRENKSYKQLVKWQTINMGKKKKGLKFNSMAPIKDFGAGSEVDWLWAELERKEKEIEGMQDELQQGQAASVGLNLLKENTNLKEELEEKDSEVRRRHDDVSNLNAEHETQMIELKGNKATLQRKVSQLEAKLKESEQENIMLWEDVHQYQEELEEAKKKLADGSRRRRNSEGFEEEFLDEDRESRLEEMMREMDSLMKSEREKMASVMEDVEYLQVEVDRLRDVEVSNNHQIATLHGNLKAANDRSAHLQNQVDPLQTELDTAKLQVKSLKEKEENLTSQIDEDHRVLEELRQRIRDLQQQLEDANMHFADTKAEYADKCRILEEKVHTRTQSAEIRDEMTSSDMSASGKPSVELVDVQDELESERQKRLNREKEIETLKATISQLNGVISSSVEEQQEAVAAAVEEAMERSTKQEEALNKKIRELNREIESLNQENRELRAKVSRLEAALMEERVRVEVKNEEIQRLIESNKRMATNRPFATPMHERRISLGEAEPAQIHSPKLADSRLRSATVSSDRDSVKNFGSRPKTADGVRQRRTDSHQSLGSVGEEEEEVVPSTTGGHSRLWNRLNNMLHDKDELIKDLQLNAEKMATQYSKKRRGDSTNLLPAKSTPTVQSEIAHYLSFMNDVLKDDKELTRYIPVSQAEIGKKFRDGILLCKFLNFAMPLTIDERVISRGSDLSHELCRRNLVLALNSAKAIGCELGDITVDDIFAGMEPTILNILWQIILVYLTSFASFSKRPELSGVIPRKTESGERPTSKQILLAWFNWHLASAQCDRRVENLSTDVNDGVCFNILLERLSNEPDPLNEEDSKKMSDVAERVVKLAGLLGGGHFVSTKTILGGLSRLNFLFVAEIFMKHPQLPPLSTRRQDNDDGLEDQSALIAWINHLGIKPMISNLVEDIRDGLVVIQAINIIHPGLVDWHKVCKAPSNRYRRLENCNYAVHCGREMGLQLVNISGEDMEKGNSKLVMSFIWQLRYFHMMAKLKAAQKEGEEGRDISDADILRLANQRVEEAGLTSRASTVRDSSLRTSEFLVDLLEATCPKSTQRSLLTPGSSDAECLDNARYAISVARMIGCSVFITPQHIIKLNKDMLIVFIGTLLSY